MSSSNPTLSLSTSKNANIPNQTPSPSQSQYSVSSGVESYPQRRVGGSGSFGAGSTSRGFSAAARSSQPLRKQNKNQRRPRLADEDAAAESAVMHSTRNRKGQTSITHLMNFVLPPRPQNPQTRTPRNVRGNPSWGLGSGYHATDKARYIHANYRFIVDPRGDYRAQTTNADVHLDWNSVLQILASAQSQSANCPICLTEPVASRMAKCGHIFCLPCLIRYMHSTDENSPFPEKKARWKKCPICWDSVYMSEIRPVRWFIGQEGQQPQEGEDIILRLVTRQHGSTLALPRDGADALDSADDIPWYFAAEVMDYARIMKGSESYMEQQYDKEIEDLQRQEQEDELLFGEENVWASKAVNSITEAKERLKGLGDPPTAPVLPSERGHRRVPPSFYNQSPQDPSYINVQHAGKLGLASSYESSTSSELISCSNPTPDVGTSRGAVEISYIEATSSIDGSGTSLARETSSTPRDDKLHCSDGKAWSRTFPRPSAGSDYFFYEALLHYYLSPLDIRILKTAFGQYSSFPSTILPRVERVSGGHIVDDELRRRTKYLAHLPHGCEVAFLECDWTDIVGPEILNMFSTEIERRQKRNREKAVREEKARIRAEREEDDKRWAAARRRRPDPSHDTIPEAEPQGLVPGNDRLGVSPPSESISVSSSPPWSSRAISGSAFATLASPSTSPVAPKTVWGTAAVAPLSSPDPLPPEQDNVGNDGWLQDWEHDLLQENELALQLEASSIGSTTPAVSNSKRKKGKKITLMTTNARRGA
ncbi:MAG: hypothetical protein Q9167_001378 [Letrouitia subvulpina]